MTPMSLSMGSPHLFGSDSTKRKRSDGSRLASVETHEQAGSYMSPQSARAPSPAKDQSRPPAHPSKKPRRSGSLDTDTEMSNVRAEPNPWAQTYDHPPSNTNPVGSPESMSPVRSPDPGNGMDLDANPSPQQQQRCLPPPPRIQRQVSPSRSQTDNHQTGSRSNTGSTSALPTGSNSHTWTDDDKNLIEQLRSPMSKEPGYDEFLESRNKQLTVREQLKHYRYITKQLEEHTRGASNARKV